MQFNNSQSGYQNFIPVYSNLSPYYQQPEGSATANAMASNIPDDSLLYDMYDYNRAVTATTASTSGTPIIPSQPSPPPSSSSPSPRAQEENVSTAEADRKRPKRRQVKNACVNCQKACKKCDDGRPCQRCIKLGLTATCTNSPRKERKKGVKRGPYKKRQHLDSAHDNSSPKFSDWEEGRSCSEFVSYTTSAVPSIYHHDQVSSEQVAPLSSSPLSSDARFSYLSYGGVSITTAADASSASGASLSPVSPHFPSSSWEDHRVHHYPYSAAAPTAGSTTATHQYSPDDLHHVYSQPSAIFDHFGYEMPYQYSTHPDYTTRNSDTSTKYEDHHYLYPLQTTSETPASAPFTPAWATYSNYIEQQQQQQQQCAEQQPPSTGYWQTFLATM